MKITIHNVLGIREAEVELTPGKVVEVFGPNAAGKSSLALCAQAVLSQDPNPLGLPATQSRLYRHEEDAEGECEVRLDGDMVVWDVSNGSIVAVPQAMSGPHCAPEAVGLVDMTARRGGKERAALLHGVLLPDPGAVIEKLREELGLYLKNEDIVGAVREVEKRGWQAAETVYQERMRATKRDWCKVTGLGRYGSKIAADWHPDGWLADYDAMTVEDAERAVESSRSERDEMLRENAVSEAALIAAEKAKAELPGLREKVGTLNRAVVAERAATDTAGSNLTMAARERSEPRRMIAQREASIRELGDALESGKTWTHRCPQCSTFLVMKDGELGAAEDLDEDAIRDGIREHGASRQRFVEKLAKVDERIQVAERRLEGARSRLAAAEAPLADARAAVRAAEPAAAIRGVLDDESRRQSRSRADAAVSEAERAVSDIRAAHDAGRLHDSVAHYEQIARALGPTGVRASMLALRLNQLNRGCDALIESAGWPSVTVSASGTIQVRGRPVQMCSESERWRAQAVLQLTIAALTRSQAVVLDRADLLDASGRQGLAAALSRVTGKRPIAVLLCSTDEMGALEAPWRRVALVDGRTVDVDTGETA